MHADKRKSSQTQDIHSETPLSSQEVRGTQAVFTVIPAEDVWEVGLIKLCTHVMRLH